MSKKIKNILHFCSDLELLYVEDDDNVRLFTLELLSRFFKKITVAKDGEEGLKLFKTKKYDLIISDISMPNMDGLDMTSKIRDIDNKILIVLLSAYNESNFKDSAHNIGVENYLEKPLLLPKLIEFLVTLMNKE